TPVKAGENVGCGRDHTLYATSGGYVHFHKKGPNKHKFVSVLPTKH
ncbi:MAG: 50S ribosomal protein L27, partial [Pseudomonadota bacterium]|nr:50S ribosomal protein L27 [Pseudomonadota bacterium]